MKTLLGAQPSKGGFLRDCRCKSFRTDFQIVETDSNLSKSSLLHLFCISQGGTEFTGRQSIDGGHRGKPRKWRRSEWAQLICDSDVSPTARVESGAPLCCHFTGPLEAGLMRMPSATAFHNIWPALLTMQTGVRYIAWLPRANSRNC